MSMVQFHHNTTLPSLANIYHCKISHYVIRVSIASPTLAMAIYGICIYTHILYNSAYQFVHIAISKVTKREGE